MRVAIAHDFLVQYGGAERVLEVLCEMFPRSPVFSLFYDEQRTRGRFRDQEVHTSFLSRLPFAGRRIGHHHHLFFWSFPTAIERFDLSGFDLVLSSSASYSKGVRPPPHVPHVCYCYTPTRYLWEDVRKYVNGALASGPATTVGEALFRLMRRWDRKAALRPTTLIAVSTSIAGRIRQVYGRTPDAVIFPPVDTVAYSPDGASPKKPGEGYLLMVGRLLPYKRFDLGIEACGRLGVPLKIAGVGRERARLQRLAGPTVEFLDWVNETKLPQLYRGARAFIFPQVEDFGLVAAEAVACGTPVIAYRGGGALDIVQEGRNGFFFDRQDPDSLAAAIRQLDARRFQPRAVSETAQRFSRSRFETEMLAMVRAVRPPARAQAPQRRPRSWQRAAL
ncbi:MAG: glycosyltransferase [Acidobacteriia bacterium]|nr:glycosyltransferase [Terriglobia bacterium]